MFIINLQYYTITFGHLFFCQLKALANFVHYMFFLFSKCCLNNNALFVIKIKIITGNKEQFLLSLTRTKNLEPNSWFPKSNVIEP